MKALLTTLFLVNSAACDTKFVESLDLDDLSSHYCVPPPDLAQPQPKCAAAKGLPGDNLLCVDFAQTSYDEVKSTGWTFSCDKTGLWDVVGGKLLIKNFSALVQGEECRFLPPAVSASDYSKYRTFTLSIIQRIELFATKQSTSVYLGQNTLTRTIWSFDGSHPFPRQRNTIEIDKSLLPNGGTNSYQPIFKLTSDATSTIAGWQIESIAIQGAL